MKVETMINGVAVDKLMDTIELLKQLPHVHDIDVRAFLGIAPEMRPGEIELGKGRPGRK